MARTRIPPPPPTCQHLPSGDGNSQGTTSATQYTPNFESWEHLQWARVMQRTLIKLSLPTELVEYFERVMTPYGSHTEDYFPEGVRFNSVGVAEQGKHFPRFTQLPAELRRLIWIYAIEPRLLSAVPSFYGHEFRHWPLILPLALPGPAYACSEARSAILSQMSSIPRCDSVPWSSRAHRISSEDIVYTYTLERIPELYIDPVFRREIQRDIAGSSLRHVALDFFDLLQSMDWALTRITSQGNHPIVTSTWSWLKRMESLESLTLITNTCTIVLGRDQSNEPDLISDEDEFRDVSDLVFLEDRKRFEHLSRVWHGSQESTYLNNSMFGRSGFMFGADSGTNKVHCVDCESEMWEMDFQPRFLRAWLKLLVASEGGGPRGEEGVFPASDGLPDTSIPWVREALGKMPEIRPAVRIEFRWNSIS